MKAPHVLQLPQFLSLPLTLTILMCVFSNLSETSLLRMNCLLHLLTPSWHFFFLQVLCKLNSSLIFIFPKEPWPVEMSVWMGYANLEPSCSSDFPQGTIRVPWPTWPAALLWQPWGSWGATHPPFNNNTAFCRPWLSAWNTILASDPAHHCGF